MYGWRAKIGVIKPIYQGKTFAFWFDVAPPGVEIVPAVIGLAFDAASSKEELLGALARAEELVSDLVRAGCDCVVVGGVPLTVTQGLDFERQWHADLEDKFGVPIVAPVLPYLDALSALEPRRVAVATYFSPDVNDYVIKYAEDYGIDAVMLPPWPSSASANDAMRMAHNEAALVDYQDVYRFCQQGVRALEGGAEALTIVGGLYTAPSIDPLERDLGIGVVTGDVAQQWDAYRRVGVELRCQGYGRLLAGEVDPESAGT